jgi:hypothetical protein
VCQSSDAEFHCLMSSGVFQPRQTCSMGAEILVSTVISTSPATISGFLAMPEGLALAKAYKQIENAKLRQSIVALVKQMAGDDEPEQATARII